MRHSLYLFLFPILQLPCPVKPLPKRMSYGGFCPVLIRPSKMMIMLVTVINFMDDGSENQLDDDDDHHHYHLLQKCMVAVS